MFRTMSTQATTATAKPIPPIQPAAALTRTARLKTPEDKIIQRLVKTSQTDGETGKSDSRYHRRSGRPFRTPMKAAERDKVIEHLAKHSSAVRRARKVQPNKQSATSADKRYLEPPVERFDPFESAVCRQMDPDIWFPKYADDAQIAIALCNTCPVKDTCANEVEVMLNNRLPVVGVWAGVYFKHRDRYAKDWPTV